MNDLMSLFNSSVFMILFGGFLTLVILYLKSELKVRDLEKNVRRQDIESKKHENEKHIITTPIDELIDEFNDDFGPKSRKDPKRDS